MGAVIVAAAVRRQKETVAAFRRAEATSAAKAVTLASLGLEENMVTRQLKGHAVLREVKPGSYYLDEPSWAALENMRGRMALVVTVIGVLVLLGVWLAKGH